MITLGGILQTSTCILSNDGSRLLVACGSTVRLHSVLTGDCLLVLSGHAGDVTAICRHTKNEALVYTAGLDGVVILWEYESAKVEAKWQIQHPIQSLVITGRHSAVASVHWSERDTGRLVVLNFSGEQPQKLGSGAPQSAAPAEAIVCKLQRAGALAVSPSKEFVAAVDGPRVVVLCLQHNRLVLTLLHTRPLTCAAFDSKSTHLAAGVWPTGASSSGAASPPQHVPPPPPPPPRPLHSWQVHIFEPPTRALHRSPLPVWQRRLFRGHKCAAFDSKSQHLAAADASGRILVWSGLSAAAQRAATSGGALPNPRTAGMHLFEPPHWHAHPVGALGFSSDGAYLLSGGRENTLVIWQLQTMRRTYLPRLGGNICHIGNCPGDAALFVVGQADNAVRIVSIAQMATVGSVRGVRPRPAGLGAMEGDAGCAVQPGSCCLLLPGLGGSVQMYDLARDRHCRWLQVIARNDVSLTASGGETAPIAEPAVRFMAFTADALSLVTVESRPAVATGGAPEYTVKFWDVRTPDADAGDLASPTFSLNTAINDPHLGAVTALAVHPELAEVTTAGVGRSKGAGDFRRWLRRRVEKDAGEALDGDWFCAACRSYKGGASSIALWSSENTLGPVLVAPADPRKSTVSHLCFLPRSAHLVSTHRGRAGNGSFCVWNLLTLSLEWCRIEDIADVAAHPTLPLFAVAIDFEVGKNNSESSSKGELGGRSRSLLAMFEPDSPTAKWLWLTAKGSTLTRALFVPAAAVTAGAHRPARHASEDERNADGGDRSSDSHLSNGQVPAHQASKHMLLLILNDRRLVVLPGNVRMASDGLGLENGFVGSSGPETGDLIRDDGLRAAAEGDAGQGRLRLTLGLGEIQGAAAAPEGVASPRKGGIYGEGVYRAEARSLEEVFDAPSHLLPATNELCESVLRVLLRRQGSENAS